MPDAVKLILSLSVSGSTLALLLFALKRAFRNRLPKAFQYYVWLVVLLRLALPVSFGFSAVDSIFRAIPGISADTSASAALSAGIYRPNKPILVQPGEVFSFNERVRASDESGAATRAADYLLLVWLAGAAIALGIKVFGYARFSARLKKAHRSARPCEEQALKRLHSGKIAIERNPLARTPMLMGLFRPVIVLPDRAYSSEELICVLEHELTHYKRLDIPLKWLSLLVCCAHWFNPLAYFIHREIDKACELSCDEAVIKALDAQGKQAYGETLISALSPDRFSGALATMCRDKAVLKERLIAIMNYKRTSNSIKALSAALLMLVAAIAGALGACAVPAELESDDAPPTAAVQPELNAFHFVFDERIYVTNDSDSSDVRALQTRLNELAVSHPSISKIEVSGSFGEETRAAVIEAQRVFGLAMDGLAGPDTWFALAPFDGAAVFSKKSGEVLAITTHADPSFEGSQADAAAEPERGAWIVVAPQGASAGIAE